MIGKIIVGLTLLASVATASEYATNSGEEVELNYNGEFVSTATRNVVDEEVFDKDMEEVDEFDAMMMEDDKDDTNN